MKKSRFTESQIVSILKEADAGLKVNELCRKHGWLDGEFDLKCKFLDNVPALYIRAEGFIDIKIPLGNLAAGALIDNIDIRLDRSLSISGRVEDLHGNRISGALILKQPISTFASDHADDALGITNDEGVFVANGVIAGVNDLLVVASSHPPKSFEIDPVQESGYLFMLDDGESLEGHITVDGEAVTGDAISVSVYTRFKTNHKTSGVKSDANGYFRFDSVPPGRADVYARLKGETEENPTKRTVQVIKGGAARVEFALSAATATVERRILTSNGRPLEGIVYLIPNAGQVRPFFVAKDGHYRFENVPVGPVTLSAQVGNASDSQRPQKFDVVAGRVTQENILFGGNTNINIFVPRIPAGKFTRAVLLLEKDAGRNFHEQAVLESINSSNVTWSPIEGELTIFPAIPEGKYVLVVSATGSHSNSDDFEVQVFDIVVSDEEEIDVRVEFQN